MALSLVRKRRSTGAMSNTAKVRVDTVGHVMEHIHEVKAGAHKKVLTVRTQEVGVEMNLHPNGEMFQCFTSYLKGTWTRLVKFVFYTSAV